jgi:hypothetical protein
MRSFIRSFSRVRASTITSRFPPRSHPDCIGTIRTRTGFPEGQAQGGATGALMVERLQNVIPALAGLPTHTFVIRDQILPASEANDASIPAWDLSINYVPVTYPSYTPR